VPDLPAPRRRRPLFTAALLLALTGFAAIVAVYLSAALSSAPPPFVLYALSMLLPAAMVIAAIALARDYRRPR